MREPATTGVDPSAAEGRRPVRRRLTAEEAWRRRHRLMSWAAWAFFGALLINGVVGESGYLATILAERDEAALAAEVARLRSENQRLRTARLRIEKDPSAIEEGARRQGMIRDGETIVTIRDRVEPAESAESAPAR